MGEQKPMPADGVWPTVKPFVNGGCSGMLATCVIQPIDMIKVRIQLGQGSAAKVTKNMLKNEGFGAFYKSPYELNAETEQTKTAQPVVSFQYPKHNKFNLKPNLRVSTLTLSPSHPCLLAAHNAAR